MSGAVALCSASGQADVCESGGSRRAERGADGRAVALAAGESIEFCSDDSDVVAKVLKGWTRLKAALGQQYVEAAHGGPMHSHQRCAEVFACIGVFLAHLLVGGAKSRGKGGFGRKSQRAGRCG